MKGWQSFIVISCLLMFSIGIHQSVDAQENLAQQAYAIFEQNCLNCHGAHGAYTEQLIIEHAALIESGAVVSGKPVESELYKRLFTNDPAKRMPLGQPQLSADAILTIGNWILAGAPDWETPQRDAAFITPKEMLESIESHVNSLAPFDRTFARYFTMTHLYNAGETNEALGAYQRALSKLVNSLSWGREVIIPQPIDLEETVFYIDLRDYEWERGTNRWTLIEAEYPYNIAFNAPTQTVLRTKLMNLREVLDCEVPFIHVDWFLANASLPPLYHDILDLPETDRGLEIRLDVDVVSNLRNAAGKRVWRAGFNDSGVSSNNRVVERHLSRYGAYWKSYDFAGTVGTQNIFTNPLSFTHDGGEIVFNLPNGLQAYYLADAGGNRLDAAPINIVSNPAASDPTVRNGLSCIGCHTEGMKRFEDQVRGVVEQNVNPPFDKDRVLSLYVDKATMDAYVDEDTLRYRQALEAAGGIFGGIEPVQRFHEAFHAPLDIAYAAATVGLESETLLAKIHQNTSLQNLGLLVLENGTMKRDTWTSKFSDIVFALDFPQESIGSPIDPQEELIPGEVVRIPDPNLRAVIASALGKVPSDTITALDMVTFKRLELDNKGITDLTGLEFAINLNWLDISDNNIADLSPIAGLIRLSELRFHRNPVSDLSPLRRLTNLTGLWFEENRQVSDISPLAGLINLEKLHFSSTLVSDLAPLKGLTNLTSLEYNWMQVPDLSILVGLVNLEWFRSWGTGISDLSPLAGLTKLEYINICGGHISDLTPLVKLPGLKQLSLVDNEISDISPLSELTGLQRLKLSINNISDLSPLANLTELTFLEIQRIKVSDISPLANLTEMRDLFLGGNMISDISPLVGLTKLRQLDLIDNPISDFSPLDELFKNPNAKIFTTEVDIPDPNLRTAIAAELGKASGETITAAEMGSFERLNLNSKDINNLAGLEFAVKLNSLAMNDNNVVDLSPIAGLIELTELRFHRNPVSDLSPLAGLTNLTGLWFEQRDWFMEGQVSDLSPLAGLTNLETLQFATTKVTDLSPLKSLTKLTILWPHWVRVSDFSPLAGLRNLKEFIMWGNPLASDLSPFAGLTKLEHFDICGALISDLVPLGKLTNLKFLGLADNEISDISPLAGLTELTRIRLRNNNIADISPLVGLTGLTELRLQNNNIADFSLLDGIRENIEQFVWYGNPGFPEGGPKIEGPWLWCVFPEANLHGTTDVLSEASGGTVTEVGIATHGAIEGKVVGSSVWTSHSLSPAGNIAEPERLPDVLNAPDLSEENGVLYGAVSVYSPQEQETTLYVGSAYGRLKVWLNGALAYYGNDYGGGADAYKDFFPVTLQQGKNVLLIALRPFSKVFVGFEPGTDYTVAISGIGYSLPETAIYIGDTFTVDLNAENVTDLAGWQFDIVFDPAVLEAVEVNKGDFLESRGGTTFFQKGMIDNKSGEITDLNAVDINGKGGTGTGTLLSVTFSAKTTGETRLGLRNLKFGSIIGEAIAVETSDAFITIAGEIFVGDVNRDGEVNVLDMILVSRHFGGSALANPQVDLNGDGTINIQDLIIVAQHLGEAEIAAAPAGPTIDGWALDPALIQAWIAHAQVEDDGSVAFQQGIANLQHLLSALIPKETVLLVNYPNPFNPETWIPYHLANSSDVTITLYNAQGTIVRQLKLGHQHAGYYTSKHRAAYWDGRNELGERVASGIYFYQLQADNISHLKKLVILK